MFILKHTIILNTFSFSLIRIYKYKYFSYTMLLLYTLIKLGAFYKVAFSYIFVVVRFLYAKYNALPVALVKF
jgi:hypothetical protein